MTQGHDSTSAALNPGSDAAVLAGCTCPVMDNARGAGVPGGDGRSFWITGGCPVHAPTAAKLAKPDHGQ